MTTPVIILVRPQLGENIGAVARAMHNFALSDLRLVAPRDGWPNPAAGPMAAGANHILERAQIYDSTEDAVGGLHFVAATTARPRDMVKQSYTPAQISCHIHGLAAGGRRCGILFGRESSGLANQDVVLADGIIQIPANPQFTSLNIAQAVLLIGYEWFISQAGSVPPADENWMEPAEKSAVIGLFEHLEQELTQKSYFRPPEKRDGMILNLRNALLRARLTAQEVRTFRGMIRALTRRS